ncbi:hypothetical protein GCM10009654_12920 [Streptomyces hebeiensis]|uniref:Uncharacterized protein n=1 Tax=Streptomyces hebeiensis TaxID=229486 RepID=A0ABN1ULW6_9ACTN
MAIKRDMRWTWDMGCSPAFSRLMPWRLAGARRQAEISNHPDPVAPAPSHSPRRSGSGAPITAYGRGALGKWTWRARSTYPSER